MIHGESGAGKSYLADTAPGPRLVLDVEGGVNFTPSKKTPWNPTGPPPALGPEDSAVVTVVDLETVQRAYQWLTQSEHPFRSVIIDSLSEMQKRTVDAISQSPGSMLKIQDYGVLYRKIDAMVRSFRDLTLHQTHPVDVVVFVAGTQEKGQDHPVMRPALVGKMSEQLAYSVDVQMFLSVQVGAEGDLERRGLVAQVDGIAAKDRTGRLGVAVDGPTIPGLLDTIYGPETKEAKA